MTRAQPGQGLAISWDFTVIGDSVYFDYSLASGMWGVQVLYKLLLVGSSQEILDLVPLKVRGGMIRSPERTQKTCGVPIVVTRV